MDEKKLLELLKKDGEQITPPESLQPDAIEAMLKNAQKRNHFMTGKRKQIRQLVLRYGSLAAIFLLGITVLYQSNRISTLSQDKAMLTEEAGALKSEDTAAPESLAGNTVSDAGSPAASSDADAVSTEGSTEKNTAGGPDFYGAAVPERTDPAEEPEAAPIEAFTYCESYQQIYDTLTSSFSTQISYDGGAVFYGEAEMADDAAAMDTSASRSSIASAGGGFSTTNVQEQGVDEADIIKTDGAYIYILKRDCSFTIVSANGTVLAAMSAPKLDTGLSSPTAREMYLDGDTLSIIADGRKTSLTEEDNTYYTSTGQETRLFTYDVSDRSRPVLKGTLSQEGSYRDSRKTGQYIYLFTAWTPQLLDNYQDSSITPRINGEAAPAGSIYLPEHPAWIDYLVISSVDFSAPEETRDQKVLVSGANNFYVSSENIYITNERYSGSTTVTEITKFHYAGGRITGVAAASVDGFLNNSFSLNEYQGKLRVVSTYYDGDWEEWNALYVLDEALNQLGSIQDLAKGETIRSARFFGDTGYFVTFRQTDPLFSVDLSDPANPRILGELKITGFSSYLHFYGENQLLGIGYEADETTGAVTGLKLSMFDISDPANVTETNRLVISNITWCPAIEDYKAILVDPEKNLIGFFCDNRYFVYSYHEEEGFTRELIYDFFYYNLEVSYDTMRGLYIGDTFYLAGETFVIPFDMENGFEQEKHLSLS